VHGFSSSHFNYDFMMKMDADFSHKSNGLKLYNATLETQTNNGFSFILQELM
jgi:hypothetical protein